jgi:hypothetical protein
MHSGMIGKIEKAHRYAEDPSRFALQTLSVTVHGNNGDHEATYEDGTWRCACEFFEHEQACAHTMALELLLGQMITAPSATSAASTVAA